MTAAEFKAWRQGLGLTQKAAAIELGLSVLTVQVYERGFRQDTGRPVIIPSKVALACEAVSLKRVQHELPRLKMHAVQKSVLDRIIVFASRAGVVFEVSSALTFHLADFEPFEAKVESWLKANVLEGGYAKLIIPDVEAAGAAVVVLHFFRQNDAFGFVMRWRGAELT